MNCEGGLDLSHKQLSGAFPYTLAMETLQESGPEVTKKATSLLSWTVCLGAE